MHHSHSSDGVCGYGTTPKIQKKIAISDRRRKADISFADLSLYRLGLDK